MLKKTVLSVLAVGSIAAAMVSPAFADTNYQDHNGEQTQNKIVHRWNHANQRNTDRMNGSNQQDNGKGNPQADTTLYRNSSASLNKSADPMKNTSSASDKLTSVATPTSTSLSTNSKPPVVQAQPNSSSSTSTYSTSAQLPPGVGYDASMQPLASLGADYQTKFNAVMQVAQSKLGTPYRWGHNEDRGQYGFDCSNFTAYVYHHALGYKMSGASQTQYHSIGTPVPTKDMRPGDLIIFNKGGHVGIYAGNGQMIEEGGGLGKVGYLKVSPGSYWYNHITVVKRMF
ncbi:NlpC/P60 family protein [Fodinisporobacter ferrooxydans]|uniref:NlpC/P60 family protein n=1 Tax=Fodinisporobacter ferrooxydans TaxID=2901836 RepID=A0ABY4CL89_9BACL|nr:NlpC/P60 family protein [Alicyclobacillaceae bacterium MYW30-H2]